MARARLVAVALAALFAGAAAIGFAVAEEPAGRTPMPAIPKAKGDHCVRDTAFMRRYHMVMLKHQRDETVHEGVRGGDFSIMGCVNCHAVDGAGRAAGELRRPEAFLPVLPFLRLGLDRLLRMPRLEAAA